MRGTTTSTPNWTRRRVVHIVLIGFASVLVVGIACVWCCVQTALELEQTYGPYYRTIEALHGFVADTGEWPNSWEELSAQVSKRDGPEAAQAISNSPTFVNVDFSLSLNEVAAMNADDFHAVRPVDARFGPWSDRIQPLLEEAKRHSSRESPAMIRPGG